MKLKPGSAGNIRAGQPIRPGDLSSATGWAPQQITGSNWLHVKQFGDRVVISQKPTRGNTVGTGGAGVKFLGALDYFPAIPATVGSYEFLYTTEDNGYKAYGGQTAWTALQKLTTSTGTPA